MLRNCLRPSRFGFLLGIAVIALWALVWFWFLSALLRGPQPNARGPGAAPELAAAACGDPCVAV